MPSFVSQRAVSVPSRSHGSARNAPARNDDHRRAIRQTRPRAEDRQGSMVTLVMMWTLPRFGSSASTSCSAPVQFSVPEGRPGQRRTTSDEACREVVTAGAALQPIESMASAAVHKLHDGKEANFRTSTHSSTISDLEETIATDVAPDVEHPNRRGATMVGCNAHFLRCLRMEMIGICDA